MTLNKYSHALLPECMLFKMMPFYLQTYVNKKKCLGGNMT